MLAPDKILRQIRCLEEGGFGFDEKVLLSCAWAKFYYRISKAQFKPNTLWQDHNGVDWLVQRLTNPYIIPCHAWLVSRYLVDKAGPWNCSLTVDDDGEYFSRVVSRSNMVRFCKEAKAYYRMANFKSMSWELLTRKGCESLYLSTLLTVKNVLDLEKTERTYTACAVRLSRVASLLADKGANDLAEGLRIRLREIEGALPASFCNVPIAASSSLRLRIAERCLGTKRAKHVQAVYSRIMRHISCVYDEYMQKLFHTM